MITSLSRYTRILVTRHLSIFAVVVIVVATSNTYLAAQNGEAR